MAKKWGRWLRDATDGLVNGLKEAEQKRGVRRAAALVVPLAIVALLGCIPLAYWRDAEWTGFPGNTLWDWLQLLVVPALLGSATIWYTRDSASTPAAELWRAVRRRQFLVVGRELWSGVIGVGDTLLFFGWMLVVAALLFLLFGLACIAPAHFFHMTWTGYVGQPGPDQEPDLSPQPKLLWDWINMLLLPTALAAAAIRLDAHRRAGKRGQSDGGAGKASPASGPRAP